MYKMRNNKKFLVVVNLKNEKSLHLFPLEEFDVNAEDFDSSDLQSKIRNKSISIISRPEVKQTKKIIKEV
jgi:hypothetical protein